MPGPGQISINGTPWDIVAESLLPSGRRAYSRKTRPSQESDPGRIKVATWHLTGPIGLSRERHAAEQNPQVGVLGHDWSNLETRLNDLLTSLAARSTLTLSGSDPFATASAALGGFAFGAAAFGGGAAAAAPQIIEHIDADRRYLFAHRGALSTQIDPSTWTVVQTVSQPANVKGAVSWFGKGRIALGGASKLRSRSAVTATGATYVEEDADVSGVYAKGLTRGNDRLWMINADLTGGAENRVRFCLDDLATVSDPFVVGDPKVNGNGLGKIGPFTILGQENGIATFTEQGLPVELLTAIKDSPSANNGRQFAEQWGWAYVITDLGLYAVRPGVANPVGIGTEHMLDFEGFDGKPTAVREYGESLLVAYLSSDGTTTRILRGVFGPETGATGRPDFYPFQQVTAEVRAIGATNVPTNPHVVWGEGASTLGRALLGRGGRDIDDSNYVYSTAGGQWFGTRMTREPHLLKYPRWFRFRTENCDGSNTWQLALSPNHGAAYTNVGSAVATNGAQVVRPVSSGAPVTGLVGYEPKPRLTQVAASSSAPPQIRGVLEMGYDERPEMVLEIVVVVQRKRHADLATFEALADGTSATGQTPVAVVLPGESTTRYGYVVLPQAQELKGDEVEGIAMTLTLWDVS